MPKGLAETVLRIAFDDSDSTSSFRNVIFQHLVKGGFHLHLLVFLFIYQFHSRIEALVRSSFAYTLISFAVLKLDEGLSVQMPFELPVQMLLELEVN